MNSVNDFASLAKNPAGALSGSLEEPAKTDLDRGPQIALRSDGAFILSIEDVPPHVNLDHRPKWTGVILSGDEIKLLKARLANAEAELAAHVVAQMSHKDDPK